MNKIWDTFFDNLLKIDPNPIMSMLRKSKLESVDALNINVIVNSGLENDFFNDIKDRLIASFRKALSKKDFNIKFNLKIVEDKKFIYTNNEKWEYMTSQNPHFVNFIKKFNLDFD